MMLYVIPFILLLIVAIFLKKREASQKEENTTSNSKTSAKKISKKTAKSSAKSKSPATVEALQANTAPVSQTTPLAADVRQKIEQRIQSRDFFAAEALINQALNRDSTQHELYLLLQDIHLQQKDEFAINQLLNQLRTLGLDDILQQAEAKQQAYQQKKEAEAAVQTIVDTPPVVAEKPQFSPSLSESSVRAEDFDALVKPVETNHSFEQIQAELSPVKAESATEIAPLEFTPSTVANTKSEEAVETVAPVIAEAATDLSKALEFKLDTPVVEVAATPVVEIPSEPEQSKALAEEPKPLEFEFKLESNSTVITETSETALIEEAQAPVILEDQVAEKLAEPEFKLDLADFGTVTPSPYEAPTLSETGVETPAVALPSSLDFNLDAPALSLDAAPEIAPAVEESPVVAAATPTAVADQNDPLAQSFPELLQVNEISLNLQLAQQYIQLGAYAPARRLLSENAAHFSPEQRVQSELLLKQIAS